MIKNIINKFDKFLSMEGRNESEAGGGLFSKPKAPKPVPPVPPAAPIEEATFETEDENSKRKKLKKQKLGKKQLRASEQLGGASSATSGLGIPGKS